MNILYNNASKFFDNNYLVDKQYEMQKESMLTSGIFNNISQFICISSALGIFGMGN